MRRISAFLVLSLLLATAAYPCSNKYAGRSAKLLLKPAQRPASILILNSQSLHSDAKSLKTTLRQLGHRVKEVNNQKEMTTAIQSGQLYDIVMADVADLEGLVEQLSASAPGVVPVRLISSQAKEGVSNTHPAAVDLSAKATMIREKIDEVMKKKESKEKV